MSDACALSTAERMRAPTDWTLRPFTATGRSPLWIGLAIAVVYVAITESVGWLALALGFAPVGNALPAAVGLGSTLAAAALMGFLPTANAYLHRGAARDLLELRPCLHGTNEEFEQFALEVESPPLALLRWVGVLGLIAGGLNALYDPVLREFYADTSRFDPRFIWFVVQNAIQMFLGARLFATEVHMTRAYSRLGEGLVTIDLLDLRPLAAFGRKGQRSVVLWVAVSSIVSMFWAVDSAGAINGLIAVVMVALVTAAFVLPALGLRGNIRAAKAAELDRIRDRLRVERTQLLDAAPSAGAGASKLAELISYRQLIESVHEWPFDVSAVLRFLLFASLGVGSWLGGALVERAVDAFLG